MSEWTQLSTERRNDYSVRQAQGEDVEDLAKELNMKAVTLDRYLRDWRATQRGESGGKPARPAPIMQNNPVTQGPADPSSSELFDLLRRGPMSLEQLATKYDRSKKTVTSWIARMRDEGYVVSEEKEVVTFDGAIKPKASIDFPRTLADEMGQEIVFGVCSDLHAGSACSQPTNHAKFINIAYNEFGVRHIFDPGDKTTGVGGYRGQEQDLIPALRSYSSRQNQKVTEHEIWLADQYTPKLPGLTYYKLGGNHDYWHVVNSGIDAVAQLCARRDDMVYLGYDVADVPLTDKVDIRLWHPSGGVPYAMSYRLQKALEQTAFEELTRAITESENPRLRILLAGHMHIEVKFNRGPMVAAQVGCFEGQTNYLKRKGLFPQIGGSIFKVRLTDGGLIQRVEYTFIPFTEIQNDWANWPVPPMSEGVIQEPDKIGVLFRAEEAPRRLNGAPVPA